MLELGLVSAILPDYSFEELIDYAASVNLEWVEVCCWPVGKAERRYAGVTHIDISTLNEDNMMYYVNYAKEKGVKLSSLGYYPNAMDNNLEARQVAIDHIKDLIVVAGKMGINMVTTFIGKDKTKTVEENLEL